eukprot:7254022-Pyramimonas_sp.AAC.1
MLPTPGATAAMLGEPKRRKAPGQDGISGDLLRCQPRAAARHYAPIMLKAAVHKQEPPAWKHGT